MKKSGKSEFNFADFIDSLGAFAISPSRRLKYRILTDIENIIVPKMARIRQIFRKLDLALSEYELSAMLLYSAVSSRIRYGREGERDRDNIFISRGVNVLVLRRRRALSVLLTK